MTAILVALTLILCAALVARGRREQVWEPGPQKRARMIADFVYGESVWVNPETPEAGIARLHKVLGRGR